MLVGPGLAAGGSRSHLYHPGHFHGYRKADRQARKQLRETSRPRPTEPVTEHDDPELREPDLPRTAKVRKQALRTGWTTGTCAAAAAKAAATALDTGEIQETVEIGLPSGQRVRFPVDTCTLTPQAQPRHPAKPRRWWSRTPATTPTSPTARG